MSSKASNRLLNQSSMRRLARPERLPNYLVQTLPQLTHSLLHDCHPQTLASLNVVSLRCKCLLKRLRIFALRISKLRQVFKTAYNSPCDYPKPSLVVPLTLDLFILHFTKSNLINGRMRLSLVPFLNNQSRHLRKPTPLRLIQRRNPPVTRLIPYVICFLLINVNSFFIIRNLFRFWSNISPKMRIRLSVTSRISLRSQI
jgi:hypothetical protein